MYAVVFLIIGSFTVPKRYCQYETEDIYKSVKDF